MHDPHLHQMIQDATLKFCRETNATTDLNLQEALDKLRQELVAGLVDSGETIAELAKRVKGVFSRITDWRAEMIGRTEASAGGALGGPAIGQGKSASSGGRSGWYRPGAAISAWPRRPSTTASTGFRSMPRSVRPARKTPIIQPFRVRRSIRTVDAVSRLC